MGSHDTPTIDLENADAAKFRRAIEDMQYGFYRRARALRPDKPTSYFTCLWPEEQVIQFENRYQREARP